MRRARTAALAWLVAALAVAQPLAAQTPVPAKPA
jgi:hypothetical protein